MNPKRGFMSTFGENGIFLGQSSKEVVTLLADEEDINSSDEVRILSLFLVKR